MKKQGRIKKAIQSILIIFICLILIGGTTGFFFLKNTVAKVAELEKTLQEKIINVEPTTIYDRNGNVIAEVGAESREIVTYEQIPQVVIDAFLAIEDSRYFKHNGFDLPRFISSALTNLKSGSFAQGGSTLTMQTIDNFIIKPREEKDAKDGITYTSFQKIESKIQEIYLSIRLESLMSKEEIITAYLNKINFGYTTRGIQRGAQYYFGKNVEQLNLSEAAFLAGVINAPNRYNPYYGYSSEYDLNYYEFAMERRDDTLHQMLNHGYITENEYNLAKSVELAFQLDPNSTTNDSPYQAYVNAVIREVLETTGEDPATTPMEIYTALDVNAQDEVNKIMAKEIVTMPDNPYYQVATSIIDNATGEIVAIGTGFDDPHSDTYRDRANKERHQPGSTVKPLIDYALAFDKLGWCTQRVLEDEEYEVYGAIKKNYNDKYHGKVTIERAISQSLNIPAFKALEAVVDKVGYDYMKEYMAKLGFDATVCEKFDLLFAIGGASFIASPTQMAGAYSIFANGGAYIEPHMVRKIVYKEDNSSFDNTPTKTEVISPQAAYMVSDLLNKAVTGEFSTYNYMAGVFASANYPVYGKTGTSDWGDFSQQVGGTSQDVWMVNYTSEYTIATWTGFDARVDGYTYLSQGVKDMNIPGKINRYLLDQITYDAHRIKNPGGISEYGGGLIKTEFLKDAAKNNPETKANMSKEMQELEDLLKTLEDIKAEDYTKESFEALQKAIKAAEDSIENFKSVEAVKEALEALQKANEGLKEVATNDNKNDLWAGIKDAYSYINTTKYEASYVSSLQTAITNAEKVVNSDNVSKEEIEKAISSLQNAIKACKDHPVVEQTPPPSNENQNEGANNNEQENTGNTPSTDEGENETDQNVQSGQATATP